MVGDIERVGKKGNDLAVLVMRAEISREQVVGKGMGEEGTRQEGHGAW